MNFLNVTLLVGGLAAAIPIALHLLGRREPKRVTFPAIRFLTRRLETHRRRLQVRRWALLAMRCALLAGLAMALAQPEVHRAAVGQWLTAAALAGVGLIVGGLATWAVLAGRPAAWRWGLGALALVLLLGAGSMAVATAAGGPQPVSSTTAPAAVALLVDNSPTMGYQPPGQPTRMEAAKEMALWILGRYPQESRFALLDRSPRPATFSLDASTVQKGLDRLEVLETTRPLEERIEAAVRLLRTSQLQRRTLFIFTDLAQTTWSGDDASAMANRLAALVSEPPEVAIQIVDVGSEQFRNRWIESLELVDPTPAAEVASTVTARLRSEQSQAESAAAGGNESAAGAAAGGGDSINRTESVTVQLRLYENEPGLPVQRDGVLEYPRLRTADRQEVSLNRGGAGRVTLTVPPLPTGIHHGLVELIDEDPLTVDDVRYFTLRVASPRRVLVVADSPDEQRLIATMLNPRGANDPRREYEIEFSTVAGLRDVPLDGYAAIGLFNPSLPPTLTRDRLDTWVQRGGSLFLAMGPAIDPTWSESGEESVTGTSPRVAWSLAGNPRRVWRVPQPGTFLQVTTPGHPILAALSGVAGGAPWNAFRIYHYWQLEDDPSLAELARMAGTEHIALAERVVGQGRVILFTTPLPALVAPADRWNDLLSLSMTGAWPVYLILVQQVFEDLSGGGDASMNVLAGQPVALPLGDSESDRWQLFAPDQTPVPVDASDQVVAAGIPRQAGNYWMRGSGGDQLGFSANLLPEATRLQRIDPTQIDDWFGAEGYQLVRDRDEIQLAEGESSDGRPLYAVVMLVVVSLFLLEQVLANRFYRSSAGAPAGRSAPGAEAATAA